MPLCSRFRFCSIQDGIPRQSTFVYLNYIAEPTTEGNYGQFIDVLDINGKIIARFYAVYNKSDDGESYDIYGNGTLICRIDETVGQYITKYTDYNIMNTKYGKDVLKMLSDACQKHGMKFSVYYSCPDWHYEYGYNPNASHQWKSPHKDKLDTA